MKQLSLLLILVLASAAAGQGASGAPTPPTDPNGWVKEIQVADKLAASGYLDAAQTDYESVVARYPQNVAGIDKAWAGLARIHMARYEYDQAKECLESILTRNNDAGSVTAARASYRQLRDAADGQVQQAQQALQFAEYQYYSIPFFNVFAKIFSYMDLRSARKAYAAASQSANTYDPHYLIDMGGGARASGTRPYGISDSEFQASSTLAMAVVDGGVSPSATTVVSAIHTTGTSPAVEVPRPVASATPTASPSPAVTASTVTPSSAADSGEDLASLQRDYQQAYRKVQMAIAGNNQSEVIAASAIYQKALDRYHQASKSR